MSRDYDLDDRAERRPRGRHPVFTDPNYKVDYKDIELLKQFVTERGKIVPGRLAGLTARKQRAVRTAINRARMIALMPFAVSDED